MGVLAVLAKRFAVIAGGDDEGLGGAIAERAQQSADLAVHGCNFLVVALEDRPRGVAAVRRMRLEEMDPEEKWSLVVSRWSLVVSGWSLVVSRWSLVVSRWSLVVSGWSLVVRRWSLVVSGWSLVVGRWSLVVGSQP